MSDWLKFKPYEKPSRYDQEYLEVANRVLEVLMQNRLWLEETFLEHDEYIHMAVSLTSYLEDVVNDIGIWRFFIETNKEKFDFYVPFYSNSNYQLDEINLVDVYLLVFYYHFFQSNMPINPYFLLIGKLARELFEVLSEEYSYVPETDFYKEYFSLSPEVSFFEVKLKLEFLALNSYLLFFNLGQDYRSEVQDFIENPPSNIEDLGDPGPILYQMTDRYLFVERSSFAGLSAKDWLLELSKPSKEIASSLQELDQDGKGFFFYKGSDDQYHHLIHLSTKQDIKVVKESVDIDIKDAGKLVILIKLNKWKGEWWMSGALIGWPVGSKEEAQNFNRNQPGLAESFWLRKESHQKLAFEQEKSMEKAFHDTFGKSYVLVENPEELNRLSEQFFRSYNEGLGLQEDAPSTPLPKLSEELEDEVFKRGLGFAYISGIGTSLIPELPYFIDLLSQKRKLDQEESLELFYYLFVDGCHPSLVPQLLEDFPSAKVYYPFEKSTFEVRDHAGFLLRLFQPKEFARALPSIIPIENG